MKILSVHNFYRLAGGEDVVWRNEAALLRSKGHQVSDFVRRNTDIGTGAFASARLGLRAIWSRESMREIAKVLRAQRPHLAHFHNFFPLISPAAYYACRECGVPVVQTLHNYRLLCPAATFYRDGGICEECVEHGLWRSVRHSCYRGSRSATVATATMLSIHRLLNTWRDAVDCFIAPSEFCRRKFVEFGWPARKIMVKPNFLVRDPGLRSSCGHGAVFVGRLSQEKGASTLLAAWNLLSAKIPLRILGDGPLRNQLEEAPGAVPSAWIRFEGWAGGEAVIDAIKSAQFLVLPSECYETFGMVAVEAFACGVPVIASRLGVMSETISDGRTGLCFEAGDPGDLAAKVQWAWDHPMEMEIMGRNARAEYESKYTSELNYALLMKIYAQALADRGTLGRSPYPPIAEPMRRQA